MQASSLSLALHNLDLMIDRSPLTVVPETPALDAIALMAKSGKGLLVQSATQVVGYCTAQDVVNLVNAGVDFKTITIAEVMQTSDMTLKLREINVLPQVLYLLCQDQRLLPVVDDHNQLIGTITFESIGLALATSEEVFSPLDFTVDKWELFSSAIDTSDDAIIITKVNPWEELLASRIVYVNPAFTAMSGYSSGDILGETLPKLLGEEANSQKLEKIGNALQAGSPFKTEIIHQHQNGSCFWVELNIFPLKDRQGTTTHIVYIQKDISKNKQIEESLKLHQELLQQLTNNITQVFSIWDLRQEQLYYVSQAYEKVWGKSRDRLYANVLEYWDSIHHLDGDRFNQQLAMVKSGESLTTEYRIVRPNGEVRYLQSKIWPLKNEWGEAVYLADLAEDVTEEQQIIADLEEHKHRLSLALKATNAFYWERNLQNDQMSFFMADETVFHQPEISYAQALESIHPDDHHKIELAHQQAIANASAFELEVRLLVTESLSEYKWYLARGFVITDTNNQPTRLIGVAVDITSRVLSETKVKHREQRFSAIFNGTFQFTCLLTLEGIVLEANRTALEFGGLEHQDVFGLPLWQTPWWDTTVQTQEHLKGAIAIASQGEFVRYEVNMISADSTPRTIDFSLKPLTNEAGTIVLLIAEGRDIHDLKQAQAALELVNQELETRVQERTMALTESNRLLLSEKERFHFLAESIPQQVWIAQGNGNLEYVNQTTLDYFGCTPEEILDWQWQQWVHPDDLSRCIATWKQSLTTGESYEIEFRLKHHHSSTYRWHLSRAVALRDHQGKVLTWFGTNTDIDDRKQEAATMQVMQQQLQAILDHSSAVMYVIDTENKFLLVNKKIEQILKLSQTELINQPIQKFWDAEIAQDFIKNNLQVISSGQPLEVEELATHDDGLHTYLSVKFPLKDINGMTYAVCGISTDITDRKRAEQELRQSEERFRILVEGVKDYAIYMLDPTGKVMSWNYGAECITGYKASEIIGKEFACFFPPEEVLNGLPNRQLEIAYRHGRFECESLFVRKDGTLFWANCIL
ncbi:two-component sensor histidine kinase [Richelia sinica FACHB-800]|uniref:histidine kinase n=1 Tax=Richelia sinica FACHB-800 TaxID=1357546 RepID=A0A975Y6P1_9NOST|nr:PAS domain S-box protein [Richelia sinica]MBD2666421.1 PAS domain S-box protein [Richelia sinica FACHB-800]QXE25486.1 two-component sensor histidine kinase [Richelia sinica FACHB-800]